MSVSGPTIDLNCDLGEGTGHDDEVMPLISSANVCAGAHAGTLEVTAATVRLAMQHGVAVGAHPGHDDREHFGRRELPITPAAAAALIDSQIGVVAACAGPALRHVKLHGGLYHQVGRDQDLAAAVAAMLAARWPRLAVFAEAGSVFAAVARSHGLAVAEEAFCDRRYRGDGGLVPRGVDGALIADPAAAARQAVRLATERRVRTHDGREIVIAADTLCIHGDGPYAVAVAAAVREALLAAGVGIRPVGQNWYAEGD